MPVQSNLLELTLASIALLLNNVLEFLGGPSRDQSAENEQLRQENARLRSELGQHQRETPSSPSPQPKETIFATPTPVTIPNHHPASPTTPTTTMATTQSPEEVENAALKAEIDQFKQQNAQLLDEYTKLLDEMKKRKINSFEDLAKQDKDLMNILIELIKKTEPMVLKGNNIGLFGSTSTGKSTLINALLGKDLAAIGTGETTTSIAPYETQGYILWDFPGRNDEVSYFSMQYISFLKGLSTRFIVIRSTVKENSSLMKLLDANGLKYTIIVNRFDQIDEDERADFQNQIRSEVGKMELKNVKNIHFVSAKKPHMFPDWSKMVAEVENISH